MSKTIYRVWAVDCDGPGDIRYAPTFDTEQEGWAWIEDFMQDNDGEIQRIWLEEEEWNCSHDKTVCPSHEGAYDCNPFCSICEGEQEYCTTCSEEDN